MIKHTQHVPVMADTALELLKLRCGHKVLDATVGCGGHANLILDKIKPDGFLIGIDQDERSLEIARKNLSQFEKITKLIHTNFRDIDSVFSKLNIGKLNAALFDLGISSYQLDDAERGFSFTHEGALDMRMNQAQAASAYDMVNRLKAEELERILRDFGQERFWRKITRFIVQERKHGPIKSTLELSNVIQRAVGGFYRSQRIHPATRTFQALRIAVNDELGSIEEVLKKIAGHMEKCGRICVIAFHSLEDRIVKNQFREFRKAGLGEIITKKPLTAAGGEIFKNPRARSAKLRVFEVGV